METIHNANVPNTSSGIEELLTSMQEKNQFKSFKKDEEFQWVLSNSLFIILQLLHD